MKITLSLIYIFSLKAFAIDSNDPAYDLISVKATEEEYLIPTVCSKYPKARGFSCGSSASSKEYSEGRIQNDHWLIYTSAHQFDGMDKKVCFLKNECYSINENDYLINGLHDIAIFKIRLPREIIKIKKPLFMTSGEPNKYSPINKEKGHINNIINLASIYALTHMNEEQNQQYQKLGLSVYDTDHTIFQKVSVVGDSSQVLQFDGHIEIDGERAPFVPIRRSLKTNNLNSPIISEDERGKRSREPLQNLHFSGNRISVAHLDPGVSGAPLIQALPGKNSQSDLRGIYSAFNYRVSQSLFAATDQIEDLYLRFKAGERGHIKNFRGKAVLHKYDPKTQSSFRVFDDGKISENPNYYGVKNASNTDFGEAYGGAEFGEGSDQGKAYGGADFGEGSDQGKAYGGAEFGEGSETNHFERFKDIISYSKIKPGLIYNNELTIGFKIEYRSWWWTNQLVLYANTEALHAIEEIDRNKTGTVTPIKMNKDTDFLKLFFLKFSSSKHRDLQRKACLLEQDLCFHLAYEKGHQHIQLEVTDSDNLSKGIILIDGNGRITLKHAEKQTQTNFFQPWVTVVDEKTKIQIDLRNLFFLDTMNIMSTKTQDQIIRDRTKKIYGREPLFGEKNYYREDPIDMLNEHNDPLLIISKTPINSKVGPKPEVLKFR